jgi:hypothetical protein
MGICTIFIIYFIVKHEKGVNSVIRKVQSLGTFQGVKGFHPGVYGNYHGRALNCYYEHPDSETMGILTQTMWGFRLAKSVETFLVLRVGLNTSNVFTLNIPRKYFKASNMPKDIMDSQISQAMNVICNLKDFKHFVKISIGTDAVMYYHHLTGMNMHYFQAVLFLLERLAERVETIGPVFDIKGFDH